MESILEPSQTLEQTPEYLNVAGAHAIASGDETPLFGGTFGMTTGALAGARIGGMVGGIPGALIGGAIGGVTGYDYRLAEAAAISGVAQTVNSISNIVTLGGDDNPMPIEDTIQWFDDDLGRYYAGHKEAVDTLGFVAASIPVGLGGTKVLGNVAAAALDAYGAGKMGKTGAFALGLLKDKKQDLLNTAIEAIPTTGKAASLADKGVAAAIAIGAGEAALQGMVFEGMVQVGLNASPLLDEQTVKGAAWDTLKTGLITGVIGGGVEALLNKYRLGNAFKVYEANRHGYVAQEGTIAGAPTDVQYIVNNLSRESIEDHVRYEQKIGVGYGGKATENLVQDAAKSILDLDDKSRTIARSFKSINGVDSELGNLFHETLAATPDYGTKVMLALSDIARVGTATPFEKTASEVAWLVKNNKIVPPELQKIVDNTSVKYLALFGDNQGTVLDSKPVVNTIWDSLGAGESLKIHDLGVQIGTKIGAKGYTHKVLESPVWNAIDKLVSPEDVANLQARFLWAMKVPLPETFTVGEFDLPLLNRLATDSTIDFGKSNIYIRSREHEVRIDHASRAEEALLENTRIAVDSRMTSSIRARVLGTGHLTQDMIEAAYNTEKGYALKTTIDTVSPLREVNAMQEYVRAYKDSKNTYGRLTVKPEDILTQPRLVKLYYDKSRIPEDTLLNAPVRAYIAQQQAALEPVVEGAVANALGTEAELFPASHEFDTALANRLGAGPKRFSPADEEIGTIQSLFHYVGNLTHKALIDVRKLAADTFTPYTQKFIQDQAATTELSIVTQLIRSEPDLYYWVPEDKSIVFKGIALANEGKSGMTLTKTRPEAPDVLYEVKSDLVAEYLSEHQAAHSKRVGKFNGLRSVFGVGDSRDPRALYFPPPDLSKYPHVAIVTDSNQVTQTGQSKMLYAPTSEILQEQIREVTRTFPEMSAGIITKPSIATAPEWDRWYKALDDYKANEVFDENYFNAAFMRTGVAARYLPQTDASTILSELNQWHMAQESLVVREAVSLKYYKEFHELRSMGLHHDLMSKSTPAARVAAKGDVSIGHLRDKAFADNPMTTYIRTALALGNEDKMILRAYQDAADKKVSEVWDKLTFKPGVGLEKQDFQAMSQQMKDAGFRVFDYDIAKMAMINSSVPSGDLAAFTRNTNGILGSLMLKPSVLNAVLNSVGALVLLAPEINNIRNAIKRGDKAIAGELAQLSDIFIGEGVDKSYTSVTKLIHQGMLDAHSDEFLKWAARRGMTYPTMQATLEASSELAMTGKESSRQLNDKLNGVVSMLTEGRAIQGAAKWSGNNRAEEMTRAISAAVIKRYTDLAVSRGILSEKVADSYINTFVNRSNGVYNASQRPGMFTGPVGQAVGLFQTYAVTYINNLLRYVQQGNTRSAALMLGLQGTIHGMSTLPGFHALNTYLVGTLANNQGHKDMYSIAFNTFDKNAFEWLMYGALSNVPGLLNPDLKLNMYSRGDINPRTVTIVPFNPLDYPAVNVSRRLFGTIADTIGGVLGGAGIDGFLQGLEHNSISRELTGITQVVRGIVTPDHKVYSTDNKGAVNTIHDLTSLKSLVRLAGAKPLDEAFFNDIVYRSTVFKAMDSDNISRYNEILRKKMHSVGVENLTQDDIQSALEGYVKVGGSQKNWNRNWHKLVKEVQQTQANRLVGKIKNYDMLRMQGLLYYSDSGED